MRDCFLAIFAALAATLAFSSTAFGQTETVIWNFSEGSDPIASPRTDPTTGALYGSTLGPKYGTVYSLKKTHALWEHKVAHTFKGGADGATPASGIVENSTGDLYGTTSSGGTLSNGTVFELSPNGSLWSETVLYDFSGSSDGANPEADLIIDKSTGALFGTTSGGGAASCGTAYEMTLSGGTWSESVIYAFQGGSDGCNPQTRLREDSKGHLWGVTHSGGAYGYGTAFELTKNSSGVWRESTPYSFTGGADGGYPSDIDINPDTGFLYGTAYVGGSGYGVMFQLAYVSRAWSETTLYSFAGGSDGSNPVGLHFDLASNTLYGTTNSGGSNNAGTVFQLVDPGASQTYSLLHSFGASGDGASPASRPTVDPNTGYLYGSTELGGTNGGGTVWMIVP